MSACTPKLYTDAYGAVSSNAYGWTFSSVEAFTTTSRDTFFYTVVFVCSRIGGGAGERKSELKGLWKPDLTARTLLAPFVEVSVILIEYPHL